MRLNEVPANYDRASKHYDRMTDVVFGWILGIEKYRERTIDLLGDVAGATVLDVGCGTGRNFPLLVPRIGERGKLVAIDYSLGMLERARARVQRRGWANVEISRDDAAKLEGVEGPVDAVVSAWCYGIVYDLGAALERAVDLLKPGGRMAIMDFAASCPDRGFLRWLYPVYRFALERAGIDTPEDLDDAKLRAKWELGRRLLETRLVDLHEERYLQGAGLILAGRKPLVTSVP